MKRRFFVFLWLLLFLLAGCGKEQKDPLVGEWLHQENSEGYYTFREDGTGQRITYPEPRDVHGLYRDFTYEKKGDQLLLRYADGENRTLTYGVSGDTLVLLDGMRDESFTRILVDNPLTLKEIMSQYWYWFFITMVPLYFMHLVMPYSYRYRPKPEDWPERVFGTFSRGQLVQYVIQVTTMPLIILLAMVLHEIAGLSAEVSGLLASPLVFLWGLGSMELSRKIDGWEPERLTDGNNIMK